MNRFLISIGLVLAMLTGTAAIAQETTAKVSQDDASTADETFPTGKETGPKVGQVYAVAVHGDWEVRCIKAAAGKDPCHMFQLIRDPDGFSVAEANIFPLPEGGRAVAGATFVTPLGTLLTSQLVFAIDGGLPKRYPFNWCTKAGCFARVGFTATELAAMKAGKNGSLTIASISAPNRPITLNVSLTGFTAAYDALTNK